MSESYYYSSLSGEEIESRLVGGVVFNQDQALTTTEKARARANIGAGESNSTFKILAYFSTLEEMQESLQTLPKAGDAYGIGTASPYDVYVYDGVHNVWVNNGPIAYSDALIDDDDIASNKAWSSSKISTELSGKQAKIMAAGMLKGTGNGAVSAATKGTDYAAMSFTVNLLSGGWNNNAQTISNANFLASGFAYIVTPNSAARSMYAESGCYADDVTVDGQMVFHCETVPTSNMTVNIVRVVSA